MTRAPLTGGERWLVGAIAVLLAIKLWGTWATFPIPDEAYYWMWGRHPALSYFDHPPLQAWVQGFFYTLFGRSLMVLRLPALLALAGTMLVMLAFARRIGGPQWRPIFLRSVAAYLATVMFGLFTSLAFPDYLLAFLLTASGYFFFCYFGDEIEVRDSGKARDLMLGAVLLGLAGLTKYNAGFAGIAVLLTVLTLPRLRHLLRRPAIYAAGTITLLVLLPVLVWNLDNGFSSFRFHLIERHSGTGPYYPSAAFTVALVGLFAFSPVLVPAIARLFLTRAPDGFASAGKTAAIYAFWLSSLTFTALGGSSLVIWWWNIVAFPLLLPFLGAHMGRFATTLTVLWGIVVNTTFVVSTTIVPVPSLWGSPLALDTDTIAGWNTLSAAVAEARAVRGADFVAANRYETASQLGFVLDDPTVVELSARYTAFDDWTDQAALTGMSAIMVVDHTNLSENWRGSFGGAELLQSLSIPRLGTPQTYDIYLATDFRVPGG